MSMLFWNVRGMNEKGRRHDILKHIQNSHASVVGLIETKVRPVNSRKIIKCIPASWKFCNNYTYSNIGRIWVMWDENHWKGIIISISLQQITVKLKNLGGLSILVSTIYGENKEADRNQLWEDIRHLHATYDSEPWVLIGDYNICRFAHEKVGGKRLSLNKLQAFNDCINKCGLMDIKNVGISWTWHNNQTGKSRIYVKLDRGLCNTQWSTLFPESYIVSTNTSTSDHTALQLYLKPYVYAGPKVFRFFNHWESIDGYQGVFQQAWQNEVQGTAMFSLVHKLKGLKICLKHWAKLECNSTKYNISSISTKLNLIQQSLATDPFNEELQIEETKLRNKYEEWVDREEEELRLKSRQLWLTKGDRNTKFFFNAIKSRIASNNFRHLLKEDGSTSTNIQSIYEEAPEFYRTLFNQSHYWSIFPRLVVKRFLTESSRSWIIRDITDIEIKRALFQMHPDKAPGPDGFNAHFYQKNWDVIKCNVIDAVTSFFRDGKLLKQVNHTFLTLIPKKHDAGSLSDYRPISCCNVIYKIIAKILSNRLKVVVGELISKNQHAFLNNRQIGDCSLLGHEIIRDFNKSHGQRACIKIDLQKAFDSVNREFVYYIMHCMRFPIQWINWIKECLSSPSFSVLINGTSSGFFGSNRGIRQGDPLSPYIFVMVMEFWSINMELANISGTIQNFKRARNLQVSHLLFADDLLVFCRANVRSFKGVSKLLNALELNTGLRINKAKSTCFFSRGTLHQDALCQAIGISKGRFPVKYLGMPLHYNYPKSLSFLPLVDKLRSNIEGWMATSLNFAGRLELIKSIIYGSLSYWYMAYNFPQAITNEIERICANFLWKGKLHSISWEAICRPKKEGGFGLRPVKDLCNSAGLKRIWRLLTEESLWAEWMRYRYMKNHSFWDSKATVFDSGTWKHLQSLKGTALLHMRRVIGDGVSTSLWFDPWLSVGRLVDIYGIQCPLLTGTSDWNVAKLFQHQNWVVLSYYLHEVSEEFFDIIVSDTADTWGWLPSKDGTFTLASCYDIIRSPGAIFHLCDTVWFPMSSPKMSAVALKAIKDRLPTRSRLKRFGIINEECCVLCNDSVETRDHIFYECPYVSYIWTLCKLKMGIHSLDIGNIEDEAAKIKTTFKKKDKTYILARLVFQVTIWHIWLERNRRVFQQQQQNKIMIFRRIYEDINILMRTCVWKVNNKESLLANWGI